MLELQKDLDSLVNHTEERVIFSNTNLNKQLLFNVSWKQSRNNKLKTITNYKIVRTQRCPKTFKKIGTTETIFDNINEALENYHNEKI